MNQKLKNSLIASTLAMVFLLAGLVRAQETNLPDAPTRPKIPAVPALPSLPGLHVTANGTTNTNEDADATDTNTTGKATRHPRGRKTQFPQIILFGHDAELKAGDDAEVVVVIGGSAKVHGHVHDACVVIAGNLEVDGEVDDDAVVILGNLTVGKPAHLHQDAVAVVGNTTIAPGATVDHDAVAVGGKLEIGDGAAVKGDKTNVELPLPLSFLQGLGPWLRYCVFELRPLAPQVGWVWGIAGIYFLIYLLVTVLFPKPVEACVESLQQRPATTFLVGLLSKLFVPVIYLILTATGIGLILVPFLWVALFCGAIVGKVALLQWLGLRLGGNYSKQKPVIALLIGSLFITLLYLVPILGLLTYLLLSVWGLGCAVMAAFARLRREKPPTAQPPQAQSMPPGFGGTAATQTMGAPVGEMAAPFAAAAAGATGTAPAPLGVPPLAPGFIHAASLPRAGFWERMGAGFLDFIIVIILAGLAGHALFPLMAAAYFAGMWAWKGTTVGGIVLRLQVVREDGGPLTFLVALVRALAAAFSMLVLFLGFFWIGWDFDKQGWHDKIAGTIVVRHARSIPLVMV